MFQGVWASLSCKTCKKARRARAWLCSCSIPWIACAEHRQIGYKCGRHRRPRDDVSPMPFDMPAEVFELPRLTPTIKRKATVLGEQYTFFQRKGNPTMPFEPLPIHNAPNKQPVPLIHLPAGAVTSSHALAIYNERKRLLERGGSHMFFRRPPPATTRDAVRPILKRKTHPTNPNKQAKHNRTWEHDSHAEAIAAIDCSKAARLQPVDYG